MKIEWNKKYNTIAVYSLIVIAIAILFVVFVFRFESFADVFSKIVSVMAPIVVGIVIAYVLNPLVMLFENKFFKKLKTAPPKNGSADKQILKETSPNIIAEQLKKRQKSPKKKMKARRTLARALSIVLAYIVVLAVLVGIVVAVVPSVSESVLDLVDKFPTYFNELEAKLKLLFENNPEIAALISDEFDDLNDVMKDLASYVTPYATGIVGGVTDGIFKVASALFTGTKNFIIGLIIAIYFLLSKERMLAQSKKIFFALFKFERCKRIFSTCSRSNKIFTKFIATNLVDAFIIFAAMEVGCVIMGMPYATLIAVVCAVTNLIPFFGPFIGAIPSGFLILLVDPIKVLWFAIFVVVLQQIDGNLIKPFLFGETMGLPAIWVLISIIVGGGLCGIPGMILGAPVFAVFYLLFAEFVTGKLKKKELPEDTDDYTIPVEHFTAEHIEPKIEKKT
ncbi:MAG: AI-2E family transporter [Oscillospiraceae bacterium]|nr:AI-2E family transporter [Oscillospiraceae bacterium]